MCSTSGVEQLAARDRRIAELEQRLAQACRLMGQWAGLAQLVEAELEGVEPAPPLVPRIS